ncbi:MAG: restriction endonuclease subunit S [Pseudoalteromonas distincta]
MAQQEIVELPKGWNQSQLKELFDFVIGGDWGKLPEYDDFEFLEALCIRGSEFRNWSKDKGKTASLRKIKKASLTKRKLEDGDLLIEISGGGPEQPVGRTVLIDNEVLSFNKDLPKVCTNFLRLARPNNKINSKYLNYYLVNFYNSGEISKYQSGSNNLRNLKFKEYETINIPVAPLLEQKRIVEKLDSLLAQVDTIQQRLNNLPDIIKRFRQSVLAAAVSGKLTEQWRVGNEVTDVGDSIKEILNDRSVKVTARTKFPQPHLKDEEYPIPDNWKWVSLDSLASKIVDGVHHKPVYTEEGVPFMSVKDIKNGKMTFDFCKYISQETHKEIHPRCNPEKGDLLITKSGTIGRTAIVETDDIFDLFVSVALIKPASSEVNMHFVDLALRKWVNGIDISSRVVGTAIKNLHLRDMRVLAIPFAPIEEQTEIVRLVEQYFALADTLEKNLANAKQRVDNLTQSILAKAFRGELVPQDPNDEPADKLLARIKAARLEAEKLEKAAKKAAKASKK